MTIQPNMTRLQREMFGDRFKPELPKSIRKLRATWQPYIEAELGFRNYWYPICFSRELADGKVVAQKICGEDIILRRVNGRACALEDRCPHRLVPLSMRPECHTDDTISCWYHGFTMDWTSGKVVTVIGDPDNEAVGKAAIKRYHAEEVNGLVFVYIGDGDPPPVAHHVPPKFADEGRSVQGRRFNVAANWRLATENGIDSCHVFVHRNSRFFDFSHFASPMAVKAGNLHERRMKYFVRPDLGPVGLVDDLSLNYEPSFVGDIGEAEEVVRANPRIFREELEVHVPDISLWMPCGLLADPFPKPDITAFEFYVPVDKENHLYFQLLSKIIRKDDEETALHFQLEVDHHWTGLMFDDFNGDDVFARLGMQVGYRDGRGWKEEVLTHNDFPVIVWRQICSQFHRGIQKLPSYE